MTNSGRPILFFDSGIGGLSVAREARIMIAGYRFVYVADDAAFPYGEWEETALRQRLIAVFGQLIDRFKPALIVIACNTASTLAIGDLRTAYPDELFVGTVPAIKPAAERTRSGLISVLATPGTMKRQYTADLINQYAGKCHVRLVGSQNLAKLAEHYMRDGYVDEHAVAAEILPCFVEQEGRYTDIVVLACTHYPFLANRMRKMAPWPVDWIDPSEAIARRALALLPSSVAPADKAVRPDLAYLTSGKPPQNLMRLFSSLGFQCEEDSA